MNTTEIANMLRNAGEPIKGVIINKQVALTEGATWLECQLDYGDDSFDVVLVIHADGTIITPADWQGPMPASPEEIAEFDWQLGCSGTPAIVMHGLPRAL